MTWIKKYNKRVLLGTLLLTCGLGMALYPFLTNLYTDYYLAEPVDEEIAVLLEQAEKGEREWEGNVEQPGERVGKREGEGKGDNSAANASEREGDETETEQGVLDTPPYEYPDALLPGVGVLKIPALDLMINVGYGVELADLRRGPGFYPESGYPDTGNVSIAGHRTTYGAPFRNVDRLKEGDEIHLFYNSKVYAYRVARVFETHTRDWSVIDPTAEPALTLTTCHPPGWATQRLIVRAYLDASHRNF